MVWQAPHTTNTFSMCELMSHVLDNQPLVFITPNMTILVVWTISFVKWGQNEISGAKQTRLSYKSKIRPFRCIQLKG